VDRDEDQLARPVSLRVAVVGAGWAGLSAAVEAVSSGHTVALYEMAAQAGGRARSLAHGTAPVAGRAARTGRSNNPQDAAALADLRLDNGQHILIGAYAATLALMRRVGADPQAVLMRRPLALLDAQGQGLSLPPGPALIAFTRAVWALSHWTLAERWALQRAATGWLLRRFKCDPWLTVASLTRTLPARVQAEFIAPLCVAALNTPAEAASAQVFLRVLHDALFGGPGASDLLIPRRPLAELLPEPALHWLTAHGAALHTGQRVAAITTTGHDWLVDGQPCDRVVLACGAAQAAQLTRAVAPAWSAQAGAFDYEPIITVYLYAPSATLVAPMIALPEGPEAPAQFAFDHGALGATPGVFAFVISGAAPWVARGMTATADVVLRQARSALCGPAPISMRVLKVMAEKRATFRCVPGLRRPPVLVAPGLLAAGDYIDGPYPATLEGAVRSGLAAVAAL
jgi:squalene-associated FAD-dependent desaturase